MPAARPEENQMGFMDKAKKLAEQAQQKLDEAQTQFNQGSGSQSSPEGGGVQYDDHGRPIQQGPPAAAAPPPPAQPTSPAPDPAAPPAADAPSEVPASPSAPPAPAGEEQGEEPPPPPPAASGGANPSPDPFKPLQ
jgi:hypothetical protein